MTFYILGVNHNDCPIKIREAIHFTPKQVEDALMSSCGNDSAEELVILSTCNRVELYAASEDNGSAFPENRLLEIIETTHGISRDQLLPYLYRFEGKEAVHHLFRVAAGLDSLVVGENEILGQLREAFRAANQAQSVHSLLYRLMEKALKVGKDVRTTTKINEGAVSIPSVAVELAEKIFGRLASEKAMVIGTGEMSILTTKNLKNAGADVLYIVSRNQERGEQQACEIGAEWIPMERWEECLERVDILIASTSAPHPIIHFDQIKRVMERRKRRPLFLMDIAVPRDIEPEINSLDDVYLYNIDDLKGVAAANLKLRRREVQAAEALVEQAVLDYQGWLERLKARPTLERFEKFIDEILQKEFGRLQTDSMSEEKKTELRSRIRAKLLHPPLEKIRQASENGGVKRYLEALHSLFDLDKRE